VGAHVLVLRSWWARSTISTSRRGVGPDQHGLDVDSVTAAGSACARRARPAPPCSPRLRDPAPCTKAYSALDVLHGYLDSWRGVGIVAADMARQDFDLQLTKHAEAAGARTSSRSASPIRRRRLGVGAHAVARSAAGGVACTAS
jgi:hypothetical protein